MHARARSYYRIGAFVSVAAAMLLPSAATGQVWLQKEVVRDLTGDGAPDTLQLTAVGRQSDSLTISLVIRVAGRVAYRDTWKSIYYFQYDLPIHTLRRVYIDSLVRAELNGFFSPESFQPPDTQHLVESADEDEHGARSHIAREMKQGRYLREHGIARDQLSTSDYRAIDRITVDSGEVNAIANDILRHTKLAFTYFSGGEDTRTIAWSTLKRRFYVIWGCC